MKLVTQEQMRCIDQITIGQRGIPGGVLMDRAGRAVVREALERFAPDSVAVVTGKGNNAGDGFVTARELHRLRHPVTLCLLHPAADLAGDALEAWRLVPADLPRVLIERPEQLSEHLARHDLIIDAIFGTGLSGPVRAPWDAYIRAINESGDNVLAVDIPSGLSGDPGVDAGDCVRAAVTVTIGRPKLAMMLDPGVRFTGAVVVADIGFPVDLLDEPAIATNLITPEIASSLLPVRPPAGNKGTFGKVLILAGSQGMTGAAVMAAQAAARSGAGLIYCAYPQSLSLIMESHLIEPVKLPLAGAVGWFTGGMAGEALEQAARMQAVALGPGIGQRPETYAFFREIVKNVAAPLVIDADGLSLLAKDPSLLAGRPGPTLLTPHPGEAARLLRKTIPEVEKDRLAAFVEFCANYKVTAILKGAQTVITTPGGQRYINPTGNSGLAKGGSGDVLTGLLAGLLAQGCPPCEAAQLGVFLHGLSADLAAELTSVRSFLPTDLPPLFGRAFRQLEK